MERADILSRGAYCCPVCRSGQFVTYRRLPGANGSVASRCTCRKCGMEFEVHDDREGKQVRGK